MLVCVLYVCCVCVCVCVCVGEGGDDHRWPTAAAAVSRFGT